MTFKHFTEHDWEFLDSVMLCGIQSPGLDEGVADDVLDKLDDRVPPSAFTDDEMETLREAFGIGWNVATENGENELATRFAHVKFEVESLRPGVVPSAPGVH